MQDVVRQRRPDCRIGQQRRPRFGGKIAVFGQRGQVHVCLRAVVAGVEQQPLVVQRHERAFFGIDAVGEGHQIGHKRQCRSEKVVADERIGIASYAVCAQRVPLVPDDQHHPRQQQVTAVEKEVVAQKLQHRRAVSVGDGIERLAGAHDVRHLREQHRHALSHGELRVRPDAVVRPQPFGRNAVLPRDGIERLSRFHDM